MGWTPVPGSTDPADYPFLGGTDVPCRHHQAPVGRRCRCLLGHGYRSGDAGNHQRRVLAAIPGIAASVTGTIYHLVRPDEEPGQRLVLAVRWSGSQTWSLTLRIETRHGEGRRAPQLRTRSPAYLDHLCLVTGLLAWGQDSDRGSPVAGLRSLGAGLAQVSEDSTSHSCAQTVFSLPGRAHPQRSDGRYVIAGITEPYPGAWPTGPLRAASTGDLSGLWPYLGERTP